MSLRRRKGWTCSHEALEVVEGEILQMQYSYMKFSDTKLKVRSMCEPVCMFTHIRSFGRCTCQEKVSYYIKKYFKMKSLGITTGKNFSSCFSLYNIL